MRQLLLEFPTTESFGNWIRHAGVEEAQNRLALWLVHGGMVWLRSKRMAGKTHLLHMLSASHPYVGMITIHARKPRQPLVLVRTWMDELHSKPFWIVDCRAGKMATNWALALFHLMERARELGRPMLIAWRMDKAEPLPRELFSRLQTMECQWMYPPTEDDDLRRVVQSVAEAKQWKVDERVLELILKRFPRRLDVLLKVLGCLEMESHSMGKPMSISWAKKRIPDLMDKFGGKEKGRP